MSNTRQLIFGVAVIVIVAGLFLGTYMKREEFECACGNRREVVSTTIFFFPAFERVDKESAFPFPPKHGHSWFWRKADKRAGLSLLINGAP